MPPLIQKIKSWPFTPLVIFTLLVVIITIILNLFAYRKNNPLTPPSDPPPTPPPYSPPPPRPSNPRTVHHHCSLVNYSSPQTNFPIVKNHRLPWRYTKN